MQNQYPPEALRILDRLNATFRFVTSAAKLQAKQRKDDPDIIVEPAGLYCEITDKTIGGDPYCKARGETEGEALMNAARTAITAPKPKTKAQLAAETLMAEANGQATAALGKASELEVQNQELRTQMAQMNARLEQFAGILQAQGKMPIPEGDATEPAKPDPKKQAQGKMPIPEGDAPDPAKPDPKKQK